MRWTTWGWVLCSLGLGCTAPVQADARLDCLVTYAGVTHDISAHPVDDPYPVPAVDIGGRFSFKPVLAGQGESVQRVALYVYFQTARQPVLVQHAKYLPPYPVVPSGVALDLTGEQRLYAGELERELIYRCSLSGVRP